MDRCRFHVELLVGKDGFYRPVLVLLLGGGSLRDRWHAAWGLLSGLALGGLVRVEKGNFDPASWPVTALRPNVEFKFVPYRHACGLVLQVAALAFPSWQERLSAALRLLAGKPLVGVAPIHPAVLAELQQES